MSGINMSGGGNRELSKADQILMAQFPFLLAVGEITPEVQKRVSRIIKGKSLEEVYQGTIGEILRASNKIN